MKPKLFIIFSLIVLIPMITIVALGISLSMRERTVVQDQFRQICLSNLHDVKQTVTSKIESMEKLFDESNKGITLSNVDDNIPQDSLINQVFILNEERQLEYPKPSSKSLTDSEISFFKRTKEIWDSGERFYRPAQYDFYANNVQAQQQEISSIENIYNSEEQQEVQQQLAPNSSRVRESQTKEPQNQVVMRGNRSRSYINSLNIKPKVESTTGWYSWFQGQGLNFILWKRTDQDQIIGYEFNREKFIESIIDILPKTTSNNTQHFKLMNATGQLFSWGNFSPHEGQMPIAEISLNAPIQSWKLLCYFNDSHLTMASARTIMYNYVLGGGILGILIAGLCIYFYRENTRQLRESSQKVNFVNQVSHELKTPLTNIRMYAELLERNLNEANNKAQKQLGVIVSESQRLSRLIANVLSFAQKDKETLKLNIRDVDLNSFLQNIVNTYEPVLKRKSIDILLDIQEAPKLKADSDALEQILGNLLSNVEKYVPEKGKVEIKCSSMGKNALITVSDDGPGIPAKQREKIFESFHRVSNALSDGVSGTGIGLTISRDLAKLHGGDLILLDSSKGAVFQLSIPIKTSGEDK